MKGEQLLHFVRHRVVPSRKLNEIIIVCTRANRAAQKSPEEREPAPARTRQPAAEKKLKRRDKQIRSINIYTIKKEENVLFYLL